LCLSQKYITYYYTSKKHKNHPIAKKAARCLPGLEIHAASEPEMSIGVADIAGWALVAYSPGVIDADEPVFPEGPDEADAHTTQMAVVAAAA
jgi:hypothetical protein